jgi:hypothetical protein
MHPSRIGCGSCAQAPAALRRWCQLPYNGKIGFHFLEAYERARWPRRAPTLPDLLTYLMDQHGLSRADLVPLLGTASRVSEVFNGKRELSMSMVRKLRERFQSADLLIPPTRPGGLAASFPRGGRARSSSQSVGVSYG